MILHINNLAFPFHFRPNAVSEEAVKPVSLLLLSRSPLFNIFINLTVVRGGHTCHFIQLHVSLALLTQNICVGCTHSSSR